jgi:integrase
MARQEGEVVERRWKRGRGYALRFRAYGERRYVSLGFERDGWDRRRAEEELQNIMADVRRGLWVPPRRGSARDRDGGWEEREVPTLGRFAADLVASHEGQISEATTRQRRWALAHVAPLLGDLRLDEIDVRCIDEFRDLKIKESEARARAIERGRPYRNDRGRVLKPLSPGSINKTINFLQWVLGIALEYKYVTENAAAGRRRRLAVRPAAPVHLDTATHIEALLEGAAAVDRAPLFEPCGREAIIATLVFAGPRAHELCNLSWRDVDLAGGRIFVGRSKTAAGLREIPMQPVLRDVLAAHKASATATKPDDPVFTNGVGRRIDRDNLRNRVVKPAVAQADELLEARGLVPIPRGLTTHKLRHTFASILVACGEDPISLMRQIGHTNPNFTLRVYAHLMSRDASERDRLKALVRGERVIGHDAPPPRPVELSEYEEPILEALVERGGRASRAEVLASVREAMSDRHGTADLELLPSGMSRWEARVGKARQRLVRRGLVEPKTARGEWELTGQGINGGCRSPEAGPRGRTCRSEPERNVSEVAASGS